MLNILRRLLPVYQKFSLPELTLACRLNQLEVSLEKASCHQLDRHFQNSKGIASIVRAFCRYLDNEEGLRSLKKGFHIFHEKRTRAMGLRLDPSEKYGLLPIEGISFSHPIDAAIKVDVEEVLPDAQKLNVKTLFSHHAFHRLLAFMSSFVFLAEMFITLIRNGTKSVTPIKAQVAIPNYWTKDNYQYFIQAARDKGLWRENSLVFVMERSIQNVRDLNFPMLEPATLKVQRRDWIRDVIVPGLRLYRDVTWTMLANLRDPVVTQIGLICFRQALETLAYRKIGMNLDCTYMFNKGEHKAGHILKHVIYGKYGMQLALWPASHYDSWSSIVSYQSYDVYFSAGSYEIDTFGATWLEGMRHVPLGNWQMDSRKVAVTHLDPGLATAFDAHFAQGRKLVAFFSPSPYEVVMPVYMDNLFSLCRLVASRKDWFLVIKTKRSGTMADIAAREPRFGPFLDQDNIIWLSYQPDASEHCPPGWLVNNMAFGVGDPATIMTETLSSGKPYYARYTITIDTPLRRQLVKDGFLMESLDAFEATLKTALNDIKNVRQPDDIYKTWFDPFQDDDAMGRMASVIYQDPGVPTQSDSA